MTHPTPCAYLVTAHYLLTQARAEPQTGQAVAVDGGRVLATGDARTMREIYAPREILDFGQSMLMPGLINAHTHASMTLMRGSADDLPLLTWLHEHIFPMEARLTPALIAAGARLACAEMARFGVTTFCDMYLAEDAVFEAVDDAGLRVLGGEGVFGFPSPGYADEEACFARIRRQAARWKGHARVRVAVMPHSVYTTSPALLDRCRDVAEELDLPLHIHLAETTSETSTCLERYGVTPLRHVLRHGLLTPRASIAHGVVFDDEELDLLAASGASVVHCPRSNMKLASGIARVPEMLRRGIPVALGTDGAASANNLNMTAEMNAAALLHKAATLDPTTVPAREALAMATENAARALAWPELGRIAPGSPADIIAVDCSAPHMQPVHCPVSNLVYAATGTEVRMTMVDGVVIYKDGAYPRMDIDAVLKDAVTAAEALRR